MLIGIYSFVGNKILVAIDMPSTVISINDLSFAECTSSKQIIIADSITSIGKLTFDKCSSHIEIKIPTSIKSI